MKHPSTQGEHAQTEALDAAQTLEYWAKDLKGLLGSELLFAAAKLRSLHAQVAALTAAPKCLTCNDHGAVGNILTAEPCPDCTAAQPEALAHELFAAAQLAPGEGIEDAVSRIAAALTAPPAQPAAPQGVAYAELPEPIWRTAQGIAFSERQLYDFADRTHALRASNGQAPAGAKSARHYGPLRDADAEYGKPLSVYATTAQAAPAAGAVAGPVWKLVPIEPTREMMDALHSSHSMPVCYRAMLAEAPTPAAQADSVPKDAERYRWLRNALADRTDGGKSHWFCSIADGRPEELDAAIDAARKQGGTHD